MTLRHLFIPLLTLLSLLQAEDGFVPVNSVAATVNGEVITKSEIRMAALPIIRQLSERYPKRGPEFQRQTEKTLKRVLNEMIDRELILDKFKELGGDIPEQTIKEEVKNQIDQLYGGDEVTFLNELKRIGMSRKNFEKSQRDKIIVGSLKQQRYATVGAITPSEIQNEFNKEKARFRDTSKDVGDFYKIFLPPGKSQQEFDANFVKGQKIVEALKSGKRDFQQTARELSTDGLADKGGEWFGVKRGDLNEEFAAVLFDSKPGDILGPVPSNFGFSIIKVKKLHFTLPTKITPEIKNHIENKLSAEKRLLAYESWIKRLRNDSLINIYAFKD